MYISYHIFSKDENKNTWRTVPSQVPHSYFCPFNFSLVELFKKKKINTNLYNPKYTRSEIMSILSVPRFFTHQLNVNLPETPVVSHAGFSLISFHSTCSNNVPPGVWKEIADLPVASCKWIQMLSWSFQYSHEQNLGRLFGQPGLF